MIREKVKKTIKKAKKCSEYVQTTSMALIMALIIVVKSQGHPTPKRKNKKNSHEHKEDAIKRRTIWN